MTPRQRLRDLFEGHESNEPVVCLHTWGRYPFDALGKGHLWETACGRDLAEVYEEFWERFPCDWLHVREGPLPARRASSPCEPGACQSAAPVTPASIVAWIDENRDGETVASEEVLASGGYAHVRVLAERIGPKVMIFPNQGAPGSGFPVLSWEEQLILIQQDPELVAHYVQADCRRFLQRVHAARHCGADGYIFSEGYDGACDLISPGLFEQVFLEPKREFYAQVRRTGLLGIGYFLGGIEPYLDTINRMQVDGVMIEESKKGFSLDPTTVRKKLDSRVVLFGNLDSCLLLTGTRAQIVAAVRQQGHARSFGAFVFANGSPICPGTPPDNLRAYLDAAYGHRFT